MSATSQDFPSLSTEQEALYQIHEQRHEITTRLDTIKNIFENINNSEWNIPVITGTDSVIGLLKCIINGLILIELELHHFSHKYIHPIPHPIVNKQPQNKPNLSPHK